MTSEIPKPNFAAWSRGALEMFVQSQWDDVLRLREANEQLRLDNKDLSRVNRQLLTTKESQDDDWK